MGKGDIKTKKGKIAKGSFGTVRPKKSAKTTIAAAKAEKAKAEPAKTEKAKDEKPKAAKK